jgi:hypothetical protein
MYLMALRNNTQIQRSVGFYAGVLRFSTEDSQMRFGTEAWYRFGLEIQGFNSVPKIRQKGSALRTDGTEIQQQDRGSDSALKTALRFGNEARPTALMFGSGILD